jgi:1,4-dihydroxy-2-naphthoate octaprenyltransferase
VTARRLIAFARLARPAFLAGGFTGFALGAAVARFDGYALDWRAYLLAQVMVTSFHLMVHFANDYYDQDTDAITVRTAWSGGSGVIPNGELPASVALIAALACAACGVIIVIAEALDGNVLLAALGVAIGVLGWSYSAPPMRLLARGLGELDTIAVVAVLVPLVGYATFAGALGPHAFAATLPGACAMFAMMLTVEIPDVAADAATGKRNLVVRWGARRAVVTARLLAAAAVVMLVLVGAIAFASLPVVLLAAAPVALIALAYAAVERLRALPLVSPELLGVGLYAITTCAALAIVIAGNFA